MKTLSIIPSDNMVVIDGIGVIVDCSSVAANIHAVQWDGVRERGHVEFVDDDPNDGVRPANESITTIEPYQSLIDSALANQTPAVALPLQPQSPNGGANVVA